MRYPTVPVIIPHFGAGMFREALMAAGSASNILLDTSSSNSWVGLHPGLTIRDVFARALDQVGPARLLFGSDCSDSEGAGAACQGSQTLAAIRRLAPTRSIERKLLYDNARRLFRL